MRRAFQAAVVAAGLMAAQSTAGGQTGQFRDVDSVRIYLAGLGGVLPAGLTADTIEASLAAQLAAAGIGIAVGEESTTPALRVGFSIRQIPGGWVLGVRAELVELAMSVREYMAERSRRQEDGSLGSAEPEEVLGSVMRHATTWSQFAVAACGPDQGLEAALAVTQQLVAELTRAVAADNEAG